MRNVKSWWGQVNDGKNDDDDDEDEEGGEEGDI